MEGISVDFTTRPRRRGLNADDRAALERLDVMTLAELRRAQTDDERPLHLAQMIAARMRRKERELARGNGG